MPKSVYTQLCLIFVFIFFFANTYSCECCDDEQPCVYQQQDQVWDNSQSNCNSGEQYLANNDDDIFIIENVTGFLQLASNERFRGVSYTGNDPCISGLLNWSHKTGFYMGVYSESNASVGTDIMIVPYLGATKKWRNWFGDFRISWMTLPGNSSLRKLDFVDFNGSIGYSFKWCVANLGLAYVPKYYFTRHEQFYYYLNLVFPLRYRFKLSAEIAYQYLKNWQILGLRSHMVYDISLIRDFKGFYLGLRYVQTNLSSHEFFRLARPVVIGFIGRYF